MPKQPSALHFPASFSFSAFHANETKAINMKSVELSLTDKANSLTDSQSNREDVQLFASEPLAHLEKI